MTLVSSLKDSIAKDGTTSSVKDDSTPTVSTQARVTRLTKPVKVPTWSRNMSLETFIKQLETWSEVNDEVPEFMKYHDFVESLKQNKDIYVAEHVLPLLEKKTDQTVKKTQTS